MLLVYIGCPVEFKNLIYHLAIYYRIGIEVKPVGLFLS
jgi:hypothetical protein